MTDWICIDKCSGCSACSSVCPKSCIKMLPNREGFLYPVMDNTKCISCGLCKQTCPVIMKYAPSEKDVSVFAARNKDDTIRRNSSSGGVFYLLARQILSKSGCVFGAALTDDCKSVKHMKIEQNSDLYKLLGSKYLQSDVSNTFNEVKDLLEKNKPVLFSGTPCQILGLRSFLGAEYSNLYTIDVVCHGVPSQKLWEKYLCSIEQKYKTHTYDVNFRFKQDSWRRFGLKRIDSKCRLYYEDHRFNSYFQLFLRDYCLRMSCYNCKAKKEKCSDISLGDFWGIENVIPEMDDNMGTSMVIIRSGKGELLFDAIKDDLSYQEVSYKDAVKYNDAEYKSAVYPQQRDELFFDLEKMTYTQLVNKYLPTSQKTKVKRILKRSMIYKIYCLIRGGNNNSYYLAIYLTK